MKYIPMILAFVAMSAVAGNRIENMTANCNEAMNSGLCKVALDSRDYPNATIPIILPTGVRRISKAEYLAIRSIGFQKDAQGRWLMCEKVAQACADWESDACVVVRSMWKQ